MRTTLAALAGAGAALAAYTPDSYDNAPPAYGGDVSSSSSSGISSSSPAAPSSYASPTTSSAAPSGTPDMPSCWTSCFDEAGVTGPADTCGDDDLTSCIEDSCSDEEADQYKTWLDGECGTASTSSAPAGPTGSMSLSHGPSGYVSSSSLSGYPHGPSSYPAGPSSYPAISSSYPVGPSGYVPSSSGVPGGYGNCTTTYSSVCTETETKIYRDTTEYEATTITHIFTTSLPSGSCSGVPYPITTSSSVPYSPVTTSDVPVYPGGNGGYPGDGGSTIETSVTTSYTTVCPGTSTTVSDGETITSTYDTTSIVTTTYQTTITVTPSSPASPPSGPSCWDTCFSENGVTSKEGACVPAVGSCIDSTCSADEAASFDAWAASFCVASTSSSPASPATTSASVTTSSAPTPSGPSCWDACFSENGVTSQEGACVPAVGSCIDTKCSEQESADFDAWAVSFCVEDNTSGTVSTTSSPATTSAATTSPSGPVPSGPSCWDSCFSQNGVTSKEGACVPAVGECIDTTCSEEESDSFDAWAVSFCVEDGELPTEPAGGIPTEYTSIKPVSKPFTYGDWTSYYTDFETVTLTSYVTAPATETGAVPTGGYGGSDGGDGGMTTATQTYDTTVTTAYTTVCTAEETDGMTTSTVTTTSTIHLTFTVTTSYEAGPTSSSVGGGEQPPYPMPTGSYTKPAGYPTGGYASGSVSLTSSYSAGPTGTPEQPPIADCWAMCFAKYEVTSESALCGDIDVETCIKAECPLESYNAYEGWLDDYCGVATTSSGVVGPTGSGVPHPTGSGVPHPTGSGVPHPTGSGSPQPSGTSAPSGTISTSSTCSLPTPTESCKRCDGQPGDDKFCGLDINTNIYEEGNAPITCNTVEYDWEITTGMVSPDGVSRQAVLVNGQSPGPMIEANWGDEIIVRVKNSMPASDLNGTTIHWHGIHQKGTNEYDGVPSITQCPIAPGETYVYRFRATQYGSSWYHSHFALQAYDGLFGPLVIHGPVQEGYEYDGEEFVALQDWRHAPLTEIYHNLELVSNNQRSAPTLDTGLINGKNTFNGAGERWSMTVTKGKTYRLRVLNAAVQSTFKFYIDGHSFKVIAADFVPIEPYETNIININNGQRYDVIFTADQPSGNYWMRSDVQAPCSPVTNGLDIKAIVHYDDAPEGEPTSTAYQYQPECIDESPENLKPIVPWNAGAASGEINKDVLIQPNGGNPNLFKWTLSGTAFFSQWSDPTLQSIYEDGTVPTYSGDLAIREDNLGEWIYVIIDSVIPLPHPIHLHGHDFLVLGQGLGPYDAATAQLNLNNPPRRDTAIMPHQVGQGAVGGYLVVAFYTDNPGVWLMHCHIGWHNAMGFALQIIEGLDDIKDTVEYECQMNDTCDSWHAYAQQYGIETTDSGI